MRKNLLLKFFFIAFCFILLFSIISCSPDSMAYMAGNSWKGEMDNFGRFNDADIDDAIFHQRGEVTMTISFGILGFEEDLYFEGTYKIDSNYYFDAILYCDDDMVDRNIFPGVKAIKYRLEMEGNLNGYTGKGDGEYKLKLTALLDNDTTAEDRIEGDWELWK